MPSNEVQTCFVNVKIGKRKIYKKAIVDHNIDNGISCRYVLKHRLRLDIYVITLVFYIQ